MAGKKKSMTQRRKKVAQGERPPIIGLESAVNLTQGSYDKAGDDIPFDVFSQVSGNTSSSSSFTRKLATMRQFGLVTFANSVIALTPLAQRMFRPRDKDERQAALKDAFLNIEVLRRIYEKYLGKILPQEEYLANAVGDFVPKEYAGKWAQMFMDSARFAGLIMERSDGKMQVIDGRAASAVKLDDFVVSEPPVGIVPEISPELIIAESRHKAIVERAPLQMLLDIMDMSDMDETEQAAVWTLIQYLKRKEAGDSEKQVLP
ncbi:MAG: hypothetical protein WBO10_05350 [Pyrinomonadaceae bacterium]